MRHVATLIEIGFAIAGAGGSVLAFRHFKKLLAASFTQLHERFTKLEQDIRQDVADAKKHLEESKTLLADLKSGLEDVKTEFSTVVKDAKTQIAGMDRRVCIVCGRLHTKFEVTSNGALCQGCGGKA